MTALLLLLACSDTPSTADSGGVTDSGVPTDSGARRSCGACDHRLSGTLVFTAASDAVLEDLVDTTVAMDLVFEVASSERDIDCEWVARDLRSGPVQLTLTGGPNGIVQDRLAAAWAWQPLRLILAESWDAVVIDRFSLGGEQGGQDWTLDMADTPVDLPLAKDGAPELVAFQVASDFTIWRRDQADTADSSWASGDLVLRYGPVD